MMLKPQDTLLALKYWSLKKQDQRISVRALAESIGISAGEASKGTKRLNSARLVVERNKEIYAETGALVEWLNYGVRYAYPKEIIGYGRGLATCWNCSVLKSEMVPPSPAFVWASSGGDAEGAIIKPIHEAVPFAASRDENMYRALSLLEVIRNGKPRELAIARDLMATMLRHTK